MWLIKFLLVFSHSQGLCLWVRKGNEKSQSNIEGDGKERM